MHESRGRGLRGFDCDTKETEAGDRPRCSDTIKTWLLGSGDKCQEPGGGEMGP